MLEVRIKEIWAREILDSRGNPTLEVEVTVQENIKGVACVPSGASKGKYEAMELRDEQDSRYRYKGVKRAVGNVLNLIRPALLGLNVFNQADIDQRMIEIDGTEQIEKLGANAVLGVSLACARAAANVLQIPLFKYIGGISARVLPLPFMNIINGGRHGMNNLDLQEFMIVPIGAPSFSKAIQMGSEIFYALKERLEKEDKSCGVGDEGGFVPNLNSTYEALSIIKKAIEDTPYKLGKEVAFALDAAANEFYDKNSQTYILKGEKLEFDSIGLLNYYQALIKEFPIISIEDGMAEDDWQGWKILTTELGSKIQLVGDDLFVTNPKRLAKGIKEKVANAILIKPNQVGTLTYTLETIRKAQRAGYKVMISHRSGETEDTTIADLAVGTNSGQIKTGSLCRTDRIAKYNQLLRIEEYLGKSALFEIKY
jgi:enolase